MSALSPIRSSTPDQKGYVCQAPPIRKCRFSGNAAAFMRTNPNSRPDSIRTGLISSIHHRSLDRRQPFSLVRYLPNGNFRIAGHASSNFDFLDSHLIRAQVDLKIKEL